MMRRIWTAVGCGALASAAALGCGNEEDRISLSPASGTVTLDGKPLEGVNVAFVPDATNPKPQTDGGGMSDASGNFTATYRTRAGLAPGKYRVIVSRPPTGPYAFKTKSRGDTQSPYMANLAVNKDEPAQPKGGMMAPAAKADPNAPPPWPYGDPNGSALNQEIPSGGKTDIKVDLKAPPK